MPQPESRSRRWSLDREAASRLAEHGIIRDLDRAGQPHFAVKVPDLDKALEADLGMEVDREEDGCVTFSVLLYDIPAEPVSYDLRFYPDQADDLQFLHCLMEASAFRLRPCQYVGEQWVVGPSHNFRIPANVLLRLKHLSLEWPTTDSLEDLPPPPVAQEPGPVAADPEIPRGPDPRDTVIRKLKEQVHALRAQVQERDKRIIELEDELHDIRSRGRSYKLSGEKRPWWKPF
ncbi:MAG: hypothetical protein P1P84_17005 [Deferrisomatales bacterium]|nr:hypothetical protein [Deferrisomatales bacterium]